MAYVVEVTATGRGGATDAQVISVTVLPDDAAETTAFLARTSGLDETHTGAYRTLINAAVDAGLFSAGKLDGLFILGTQDATTAKLNLVQNAFNLTELNAPTFTADRGYTGNASTMALQTGFIPGTSSGNYSQNSAHLGALALTVTQDGGSHNTNGYLAAGTVVSGTLALTDDQANDCNCTFNTGIIGPTPVAKEHRVINRSGASAQQLYVNGSQVGSDSTASVSLATAVQIYWLARNFNGSVNQANLQQMFAVHWGGSLTSGEVSTLRGLLHDFGVTVGAI